MGLLDILSGKVSYLNNNFYSNLNPLYQKIEELKSPLAKPFLQDCLILSHIIIESILDIKGDHKFSKFISIKDYKLINKSDFSDSYVILLTSLVYQLTRVNSFLKKDAYSDLDLISPNIELSKNLLKDLDLIKEFDLLKIDRIVWKMLIEKLKIIDSPGPAGLVYFSGFKNIAFTDVLKKFKNTVNKN